MPTPPSSPPASLPAVPCADAPESDESSALAIARELLPPALRDRKFRAHAFMSKLTSDQRTILYTWLKSDDSIETIRQKVAAPPPQGFGLEVGATPLYRLRSLIENSTSTLSLSRAMETAQDVLESEDAATVTPLREALSLMLYSRAVHAARQQVDPQCLDKLLGVITKVEKLKSRRANPRNSSARNTAPRAAHKGCSSHIPATRHIVELTVTTAPANVVNITAATGPVQAQSATPSSPLPLDLPSATQTDLTNPPET